jgi:hypothetical protein
MALVDCNGDAWVATFAFCAYAFADNIGGGDRLAGGVSYVGESGQQGDFSGGWDNISGSCDVMDSIAGCAGRWWIGGRFSSGRWVDVFRPSCVACGHYDLDLHWDSSGYYF